MPTFFIYKRSDKLCPSTTPNISVQPTLIVEGNSLGDALNTYLKKQLINSNIEKKRVSLSGLDLSRPLDVNKKDSFFSLDNFNLSYYNYMDFSDCNLRGINLTNKTLNNINFTGSDLNNVSFSEISAKNIIFNNTIQDKTSFKGCNITNFLAKNVDGSNNDFTDSEWKMKPDYCGLSIFNFKDIKDVTEGSTWANSKWDNISTEEIGMDTLKSAKKRTGLEFLEKRIIKPTAKYTIFGLGATNMAKGVGINFAEQPDGIVKTFVHNMAINNYMGKTYEYLDTLYEYKEQPYKLFGYITDNGFNTHNTLKWSEFLISHTSIPNTNIYGLSTAIHIIGSFASIIAAGYAAERIGKLIKFCDTKFGGHGQAVVNFFGGAVGRASSKLSNVSGRFNRNCKEMMEKIKNIGSMVLMNGVYNINRSVRKNLESLGIDMYNIKIGDREFLLTDASNKDELNNFFIKNSHEKIGNPFAVSYPANTKALDLNIPMTVIRYPNKDTAFLFLKNQNQERVFSGVAIYNEERKLIHTIGNYPKHKDYGNMMEDFLSNAPKYNANTIFDGINYDRQTHYAVRDDVSLLILSKETGKTDNNMDFANVKINNDKVTYIQSQDGYDIYNVSTKLKDPKPVLPNPLSEDEMKCKIVM